MSQSISSKLAASGPPASSRSMTPLPFASAAFARPDSGGGAAGAAAVAVCWQPAPEKKPRISPPSRDPDLSQSISSKLAASGPPASSRSMTPLPFASAAFARPDSSSPFAAAAKIMQRRPATAGMRLKIGFIGSDRREWERPRDSRIRSPFSVAAGCGGRFSSRADRRLRAPARRRPPPARRPFPAPRKPFPRPPRGLRPFGWPRAHGS